MPLEVLDLGLLGLAVLATAALSAVVGMAGGITLLSVMLLYLEPLVAIPVHAVIQLVSNSSRTVIQRRHVHWDLTWRFALLLLPLGYLGLRLAVNLPQDLTRMAIGIFVLLATWRPGWLLLGMTPRGTPPHLRFTLLGGAVGFLGVIIGATGPLIAPFFLELGLRRQGLIGTKAACQTATHVAKLLLFGLAGFAYGDWLGPLALLCGLAVAGTWIGSRLLERVNERAFALLFKTVLTCVALRLVVWNVGRWLG